MNKSWLIFFFAVILTSSSCDYFRDFSRDPERFKRSVQRIIPIGDELRSAREKLEDLGFSPTEAVYAGLFGDMAVNPPATDSSVDYIPFVKRTEDGGQLWIVAFIFDGSEDGERVVTDVLVQVHDRRNYF